MAYTAVTNNFSAGNTIIASEFNTNFTDIVNGLSDGSKDLNVAAITAAGAVTFNGNVTIGNASSDTLTVTASLASTINIGTNNSYDIGSSALGLASVYLGSAGGLTTRVKGGATGSSWTLTLPTTDGSAGQWLITDGSGVTSWTDTVTTAKVIDLTADEIGLTIQASGSQTQPLLTLETSTGTDVMTVSGAGAMVLDSTADAITLRVQGHSTQTNDLLVVEKSDGTDLLTVDNSGNVDLGQSGAATTMTMDGSTSCRLQIRRNTATASTAFLEAASGEINFGSLTNTAVKFYVNSSITQQCLTSGVFESTAGVKVKNTGAGSDILSWYEESTWTPAFVSSAGISASTMNGYFTRIGRVVHISGFASWTGAGSGTNDVTLSGLPYTVLNSTNFSARGIVEMAGVTLPAGTHVIATAVGNTTTVKFVYNGSAVSSDWLDYEDMTGAGYLIFSLTYFV